MVWTCTVWDDRHVATEASMDPHHICKLLAKKLDRPRVPTVATLRKLLKGLLKKNNVLKYSIWYLLRKKFSYSKFFALSDEINWFCC